jgi:hypothetical protein
LKLWLDDERPAPEGWVWVKTVEEAEDAFLATDDSVNPGGDTITDVSADHDLGTDRTGYDLLLWLERAAHDGTWHPKVEIHTMNAGALPKMRQAADRINTLGGHT